MGSPIDWIATDVATPEEGIEVLGYSPEWIDEDYNPLGIRVCFIGEFWQSAKWNNEQDCWDNDLDTKPMYWTYYPKPPVV